MNKSLALEALSLDILKYPSTPHMEGSRLQHGDEDCKQLRYSTLAGRFVVLEEKFDGGGSGISFTSAAELLLQSRGHYLTGGGRERQFNLFKQWAAAHESWLLSKLEDRFIMYGEWMHKKHCIFYDNLPHYFFEFDIFDKQEQRFLSTAARHSLLAGGPVMSVPVLYAGVAPKSLAEFKALVRPSLARTTSWRRAFEQTVQRENLDLVKAWKQCDKSDLAEGLYGKLEEGGYTTGRFKWVRADFVQAILDSDQHHSVQPFIHNLLSKGVDIYAPQISRVWIGHNGQT